MNHALVPLSRLNTRKRRKWSQSAGRLTSGTG